MSHDQKPSRVRVVKNAAAPDQRRRHDQGSAATAVLDGAPAPVTIDDSVRPGIALPGAAFLLAAMIGGTLVAVLTGS